MNYPRSMRHDILTNLQHSLDIPRTPETPDATTLDLPTLLGMISGYVAPVIGAALGFATAFILNVSVRLMSRRSRVMKAMLKRSTSSFTAMLTSWGAWLGLVISHLWNRVTQVEGSTIAEVATESAHISPLEHILLIVAISTTTWFGYTTLFLLEDAARLRSEADGATSRRFETQAQVLRRLGQVIIIFVGVAFIVFTFPAARQVMAGVLASAGIVSVIAGLAAQSTLGNVFAGLQLAFTDAIRVGDTVVAGPNVTGPHRESGIVEEITLAYVVVRVWDERRLVIPSSQFTTSTFENWTRRAPKQQGTVELRLDWAAPMAQIRHKVASLLAATDLWDGRAWDVHVTDSDKDTILVRILLSARNSSELFALRAYIREEMIHWIMTEEPWVRPTLLIQHRPTVEVLRDSSGEEIARLAAELSGIAADTTQIDAAQRARSAAAEQGKSGNATANKISGSMRTSANPGAENPSGMTPEESAAHAARLTASRQKAKKARRRTIAERAREMAEGAKIAGEAEGDADLLATQVLKPTRENRLADAAPTQGE